MTASFSAGARPVPVRALRSLLRTSQAPAVEHCELCGEVVLPEHRHIVDRTSRALLCACTACALLFEREGAAEGRYRTVPQRSLALAGFQMTDEQWDDLRIPVNMAYIFESTSARRPVAFYPSPAGATESLLDLENWQALVAANPVLEGLTPDVEALLVNRVKGASEYYIAPIDLCYQLVGIIRSLWQGFGGGEEVWQAINGFFDHVRASARTVARTVEGARDA